MISGKSDGNASTGGPAIEIGETTLLTRDVTRKALDYWQSRRGDRDMPAPGDISPQAMRAFLQNVALVDVLGREVESAYVMRLAGTKLEEVFGSITGRPLEDFLRPDILQRWQYIFGSILKARRPQRIVSKIAFDDKEYLTGEIMAAPLGQGGAISRIFLAMDIWPTA